MSVGSSFDLAAEVATTFEGWVTPGGDTELKPTCAPNPELFGAAAIAECPVCHSALTETDTLSDIESLSDTLPKPKISNMVQLPPADKSGGVIAGVRGTVLCLPFTLRLIVNN